MIVPVHVAHTLPNGTFAALAAWPGRFVIEVGASDRNTADVELLPRWSDAFLVTAEPLLDKVARALGRRAPAHRVLDGYEPLGQHHARGIVLPIAVGPTTTASSEGELQLFHVGAVAGCSSLANVSRSPARGRFGAWCQNTKEARHVWTVPLSALLGRLPAHARATLLKIDAQGYDLNVVASAGDALDRIDYVAMEVVSDDCAALYDGQPKCAEVVETMIRRRLRAARPGAVHADLFARAVQPLLRAGARLPSERTDAPRLGAARGARAAQPALQRVRGAARERWGKGGGIPPRHRDRVGKRLDQALHGRWHWPVKQHVLWKTVLLPRRVRHAQGGREHGANALGTVPVVSGFLNHCIF